MKLLDIIILIPVIWGAYKGYKKGLFMELSMLVGFVLATILGFKLINIVMLYLQPYFGVDNKALPTISFIVTFIGILIGMNFWRASDVFVRQAFNTNVVLMCAGFLLMGYQLSGYLIAT